MSKAQENKELFEKLARCEKDSEEYKRLKDEIITANMSLITSIIKTFSTKFLYLRDDMFSAGSLGLVKAVDSFDVTGGVTFASYAGVCIQNSIIKLLYSEKKHYNVKSLNMPIYKNKSGEELSIDSTIASDYDLESEVLDMNEKDYRATRLKQCLHILSERELKILKMKNAGVKQAVIAQKLELTPSSISRIFHNSIKKLQKEINHDENIEEKTKPQEVTLVKDHRDNNKVVAIMSWREDASQLYAELKAAIYAKCKPNQRYYFDKLYFVDHVSVNDIASELNMDPRNVYKAVERIIKHACKVVDPTGNFTFKMAKVLLQKDKYNIEVEEVLTKAQKQAFELEEEAKLQAQQDAIIKAEILKIIYVKCTLRQRSLLSNLYGPKADAVKPIALTSSMRESIAKACKNIWSYYNKTHKSSLSLEKVQSLVKSGIVQSEQDSEQMDARNVELKKQIIDCAKKVCTDREMKFIEAIHLRGLELEEIANEMGLSEANVKSIHTKALSKISQAFKCDGATLTTRNITTILKTKTEEEQE